MSYVIDSAAQQTGNRAEVFDASPFADSFGDFGRLALTFSRERYSELWFVAICAHSTSQYTTLS